MHLVPLKSGHYIAIGYWTEEDVKKYPNLTFVFGDNILRQGKAGQACIRDCPNAFGLITKYLPSNEKGSFITKDTLAYVQASIDKLEDGYKYCQYVFPVDGLGTGLADLKTHCPEALELINQSVSDLIGINYGGLFSEPTARVINVNKEKVPGAIYIGRPGVLSNPFRIGIHGDRRTVIERFMSYAIEQIRIANYEFIDKIHEIKKDSVLGCHCSPEPCHGDILVKLKTWLDLGLFDDWVHLNFPVNIYSKSPSLLGRMLTNMSNIPFVHPTYGPFNSVEGFWHWLAYGQTHQDFRVLSAFDCKKKANEFKKNGVPKVIADNFERKVLSAIEYKVLQNKRLFTLLVKSNCTFEHAYIYPGKTGECVIDLSDKYRWLIDGIAKIRQEFQRLDKVIIAGSRTISDMSLLEEAIAESGFNVELVINGTAKGADKLGKEYADEHDLSVASFPADWDVFKAAGVMHLAGSVRNEEMAVVANKAIVLWDGESTGSKNMIDIMKKRYGADSVYVKRIETK